MTPPAPKVKQPLSGMFVLPAKVSGHRVVLYGPGGIGKTTLAAKAPGRVAFIDAEESLGRLKLDLPCLNVSDWTEMRAALKQREAFKTIGTLVIDSGTKLEEWAVDYTIKMVKKDKDTMARNIEDYGYGKGYQHVYDTFLLLLSDLDALCRQGTNVIIICHECVSTVPNPEGEDWIRYEPKLQNPSSGKASIRLRLKEWADHVLFYGYDIAVKDGVGKGSGTKTIYTAERPHFMAKSRTTQDVFTETDDGESVWAGILK